jgi:hypothetical protein
MIDLRCDACDAVMDITEVEPGIALHPTESDRRVLPYSVEIRCPECGHVLGWNWAMVRTHYEWSWSESAEKAHREFCEVQQNAS